MATRRTRHEEFEDRIICMSIYNDIDWTKEMMEEWKLQGLFFEFSNGKHAKRFQLGHWSFLGPGEKKMVCTIASLNGTGIQTQMSWYPISKTSNIQFSEQQVRWRVRIFWQKKWEMYDSRQWWLIECRAFVLHSQLCKPSQYLRSSRGLVWWIGSADSWSVFLKHGEIHIESEWAVIPKPGTGRSEYAGTSPWEECSSSAESTAWLPPEIRNSVERDEKCLRLVNQLDSQRKSLLDDACEQFMT